MLLLCCVCIVATGRAQVVVQINAGSRASWGTNQNLFIDAKGQCHYYLGEVNGKIKDSSSFSIPVARLDSFLVKAEQLGFFSLSDRYDGGLSDGAGIFISLNSQGKKHSVDLSNKDLPPIHTLMEQLNLILAPHRIRINYGQ